MVLNVVVLAGGEGRRLRSALPKPLHTVGGKPLLHCVLDAVARLAPARVVVVCPPDARVAECAQARRADAVCVVQAKARGTADALRCALPELRRGAVALVVCADTPLIETGVLRRLLRGMSTAGARQGAVGILSFLTDSPAGYGRVVRDAGGVAAIVEHRDADAQVRAINEVYAGVMAVPADWLAKVLRRVKNNNAAAEWYLTDVAALARRAGLAVRAVVADEEECLGVNTMADLQRCERAWQRRCAAGLMKKGVRLADAARLDVRGEVRVGRDVFIDVGAVLLGRVVLRAGCQIGAHCVIENCEVGAGTVIEPFSHLSGAKIGARCRVGPFARVRPDTVIGDEAKVGNFVEIKKSALAARVKAGHLSYLGDSVVGRGANIGAGTITCNYDGRDKHSTVIGADAFIGSGSQLVAPVRVGRGAYVGAGSVITESVPAGRLALSRVRQKNLPRKNLPRQKR